MSECNTCAEMRIIRTAHKSNEKRLRHTLCVRLTERTERDLDLTGDWEYAGECSFPSSPLNYCPECGKKIDLEAPTVGGWISADKRPPKQGRYLVWGLTRFIPDHTDELNGCWQTKIAQWFEKTGWDCKVKFWQMLPEPPKEGTP